MSEQTTAGSQRLHDRAIDRTRAGSSNSAPRRRQGPLSGERVGAYQLGELLGVGGMAEVYRADDLTLRREVAIKVLAAQLADDAGYADQFRAEARRVGALSHPHLVPVYQSGEAEVGGRRLLYLVMPLLHGSLRDLRRSVGKLPAAEAVWLALQVAEGLEVVHQSGIVHCDVKPGNVLLDAEGHTLLADFGVARELRAPSRGAAPARSGLIFGTPEYMAPEQLCGEPVDQRADVYSLGAVLYELLTGQQPFIGATPYDLATHVLHAPLIPPSLLEPGIAPALEEVVLTALARDPDKRYRNAGYFALALRNALISQREDTQPHSPPRWDGNRTQAAYLPRTLPPGTWNPRRAHRPLARALLVASLLFVLGGSSGLLALMQRDVGSLTNAGAGGMFERSSVMPMVRAPVVARKTPTATPQADTPHTASLTSQEGKPAHRQDHKKKNHEPGHHGDHHRKGHGHGGHGHSGND